MMSTFIKGLVELLVFGSAAILLCILLSFLSME